MLYWFNAAIVKKTVFKTPWFSISEERLRLPNGSDENWYRIHLPDSALVIAKTPENKFVLVKQFRPSVMRETLEFPSGYIDGTEAPVEAASRELEEETGYHCADLAKMGTGDCLIDRLTNNLHIFYGTGAKKTSREPEKGVEVVCLSIDDIRCLVEKGEFSNLPCLGIILLAEWRKGGVLK